MTTKAPANLELMPARWLPLLYFGFGHVCLAAAFAAISLDPAGFGGFYYHPRMVAAVHLLTLGWVTGSILGSIYVVGPLALRLRLPARKLDRVAFALFAVGVSGVASHFWLNRLVGMAWAATLVLAAVLRVGLRVAAELARAPIPLEVKLPVGLSFANVLLAGALGALLGLNKVSPFLPVPHLPTVWGHAHLAVLGWGAMMVMGVGYRLIPMILPSAMPRGRWALAGPVLVEVGALGLLVGLATGRFLEPFAVVAAAGVAVFLTRVAWMLRHLRPAPRELLRPDWSAASALQALVYLALATGAGLALLFVPSLEGSVVWTTAYAVFGLVGFLAQIVAGVEGRVLPLFGWLWGFAASGFKENPLSVHRAPARAVQAAVFFLWTFGVPLLAVGLAWDRPRIAQLGAGLLLAAVLLGACNAAHALARLWRGRPAAAE
jgi:hypothetical protein